MEKFEVRESHGKVMESNKNIKSHGKVKILPKFAFKIKSEIWMFPQLSSDEFLVTFARIQIAEIVEENH